MAGKKDIFPKAFHAKKNKNYKSLTDMPMWRLAEIFGGEEQVFRDSIAHFGGVDGAVQAYYERHNFVLDPDDGTFNWAIASIYIEDRLREMEQQGQSGMIN